MDRISYSRSLQRALLILAILGIVFMLMKLGPLLSHVFMFLKTVLAPFIVAVLISYLLNPIVALLSRRAVPRSIAVLLIYALFIASIVILLINLIPLFNNQVAELAEHIPEWNRQMQSWIKQFNDNKDFLPPSVKEGIEKSLDKMEQGITDGVGRAMDGLGSTLNQLFIAFIVPFLAFYMLKDAEVIEKSMVAFLPTKRRKEVLRLLKEIDEALGNYIRGQLLVCIIVGLLAYIGYLIVGVPYPLLLAAAVAVFNVIPYIGPFIGAIPAVLVGITVSGKMVISVIAVNLIVQMLEGNVVSPQIVGRTLHMHPLFIIFALLVGGEVAGILGLILAVPFFAVCKVIVEHIALHYYHRSGS